MSIAKCLYICAFSALLLIGACSDSTKPETGSVWLGEADPNPIHIGESTTIPYQIEGSWNLDLIILNSLGQEVFNMSLPTGIGLLQWDCKDRHGRPVAEGVYYYRFSSNGNRTRTLRIIR